MSDETQRPEELAKAAPRGLVRDYLAFVASEGKWWMLPILIVLALVGGLVLISGTGLGPFVYALF